MQRKEVRTDDEVVDALDGLHISIGARQRRLLSYVLEADRRALWMDSGARDLAQWLSGRYDITHYKARRWIHAARVLESLPRTADALENGKLSLDKVVELCRFATPETEKKLITWAKKVSVACIRDKGDA
ncbi:MAG: DUF222 domain-containing protein, partial [Actinomycetota bacterium]